MERVTVAFSSSGVPEKATEEICSQLKQQQAVPVLIVFFSNLDLFVSATQNIKNAFPESNVIGSSTYINFCSKGVSKTGISAIAFYEGIESTCGLISEIDRHPSKYIQNIKDSLNSIPKENTCCIEFCTSFSYGEELVLDTFSEVLEGTGITLTGGSAGNNYLTADSMVSLNGNVYRNSCVYAFLHNQNGKIHFLKENIYKPTEGHFVATDVECEVRKVYEYNGIPAVEFFMEKLQVTKEELPSILKKNPIGRVAGNDYLITEFDKLNRDGSINYHSQIYSHTKISLMELDDLETVWNETKQKINSFTKTPSFSLCINCCSRALLFEQLNKFDAFFDMLKNNCGAFAGLSGYGEQFKNSHLNQTMLLAVFE